MQAGRGAHYTARVPLILFNKPCGVLSQFSSPDGRSTLQNYVSDKNVYPAGRLDADSEGLLLLTDDGALQARISQPRTRLPKCYWTQVEGVADGDHLRQLMRGVQLKDGLAATLAAEKIEEPEGLWPRVPPIRKRKNKPTSWLDLCINEGRNRQVRRMTAAIGLPTLRLVRHSVGPWSLSELAPGALHRMSNEEAWKTLEEGLS